MKIIFFASYFIFRWNMCTNMDRLMGWKNKRKQWKHMTTFFFLRFVYWPQNGLKYIENRSIFFVTPLKWWLNCDQEHVPKQEPLLTASIFYYYCLRKKLIAFVNGNCLSYRMIRSYNWNHSRSLRRHHIIRLQWNILNAYAFLFTQV